jgi:hypothetical protein
MGRNCSDALNALVSRIVCAVGLREATVAACFLPAAALLPFVVLLEPAGFVLLEPAGFVPLTLDFPVEAVLLLLAGFAVCSAAAVELCVRPATPPWAHSTVIPTREATATAPRSLPQMLVTVSSLFEPTSSTLIAFQNPNSSIPPRTTADTFKIPSEFSLLNFFPFNIYNLHRFFGGSAGLVAQGFSLGSPRAFFS